MLQDVISFLGSPANWSGADGIPLRIVEQLWYSLLAVAISAVLAVPVGLVLGHTRRGESLVAGIANSVRALPSLGLMTLLVLLLGLGLVPPILALVVLGIPPLLAGSYAGVRNVDASAVDGARAIGMSEFQVLLRAEIPNALPLIVSGLRNASLDVIATATIAAYVNLGGLGRFIFDGMAVYDYGQVASGAVLVTALALGVDAMLAGLVRAAEPGRRVRGRDSREISLLLRDRAGDRAASAATSD
nr:ABC transporter permease [Acidipropionibacterium jensenii]